MKKERVDGKVVLVYEKGDGIRRRFREALHEDRFRFPRRGLVHHAEVWYLSDAPFKRPMFGIYALAAYAEDVLWHARFGVHKRPDINEAIRFFAETRRALQNILSTYRLGERLTRKQIASQRKVVARLVESAKKFLSICA